MLGLGGTRSSRGRRWLSFQAVAAAQPEWKRFSSHGEQGWPGGAVVPSPPCLCPGTEIVSAPSSPALAPQPPAAVLPAETHHAGQHPPVPVPAGSGRSCSSGCFPPMPQCPHLLSSGVGDTKRIVWSNSSIHPWCHSVTSSLLGKDGVLPGDLLLARPLGLSSCPPSTRFRGGGKVPTSLPGPWYLHGGCHAEAGLCGGPGAPSRWALSYLLAPHRCWSSSSSSSRRLSARMSSRGKCPI